MGPHYRHTQVGWVTLGSLVGGALLVVGLLGGVRQLPGAGVVAVPLLLAGLLFATLTVEVDARELRASFTFGLIRKRFALADVRGLRAVRNPWYYGWGIHKLRGGWIWNISGFEAVELDLADGSVWRVGTDEPAALVRAIAEAAPQAGPLAPRPAHARVAAAGFASGAWWRAVALTGVVILGVAGLVLPFYLQTREPKVTVSGQRLSIESAVYGQDYELDDVTAVSLEARLPRVLARTNGFAANGLLRGWFAVDGLGKGKLFVDSGKGPFVLVRLRDGFVIVNFPDPEKTRALYEQLQDQLRGAPMRR